MREVNAKYPFVGSVAKLGVEGGSGRNRYIAAALGRELGLERIGVNHETIFPGGRSSMPHAHSTDEEFVFVARGRPSLWIDGHLSELEAGDAVAFQAGTGIAHTFINNSSEPIELLIVGEHSLEDRLYYPLNPERVHPRPWVDAPRRTLGLHNGESDPPPGSAK